MCSRDERDVLAQGIHCLINWASGSLTNRLPAISYFSAMLNHTFRDVKYFTMVNITSGNSLEILSSKRGDGLFIGEWFCGGVSNAVWLRESLLYSIDSYCRLNPVCRWDLQECGSHLTPEIRMLDNIKLLLPCCLSCWELLIYTG